VIVALAGNFMALFGDQAHDLGAAVGDPTEDEERRLDVKAVEQVKGLAGALFQAGLEAIPLAALDQLVEGADLEVIFQGDGHYVLLRCNALWWFHGTPPVMEYRARSAGR